jgi:hypothetical protein
LGYDLLLFVLLSRALHFHITLISSTRIRFRLDFHFNFNVSTLPNFTSIIPKFTKYTLLLILLMLPSLTLVRNGDPVKFFYWVSAGNITLRLISFLLLTLIVVADEGSATLWLECSCCTDGGKKEGFWPSIHMLTSYHFKKNKMKTKYLIFFFPSSPSPHAHTWFLSSSSFFG